MSISETEEMKNELESVQILYSVFYSSHPLNHFLVWISYINYARPWILPTMSEICWYEIPFLPRPPTLNRNGPGDGVWTQGMKFLQQDRT